MWRQWLTTKNILAYSNTQLITALKGFKRFAALKSNGGFAVEDLRCWH
jgi:hypothetical protein